MSEHGGGPAARAEASVPPPAGWTRWLMLLLLTIHGALLGLSLSRNAVTIDEVVHLPAGISYWHYGRFWCYHHNPPLIRLLYALPAVLTDVPTDYRNYHYEPGSRRLDSALGRDFMLRNRDRYLEVYALSRSVVAALSVLGGYLVFRWSRELFGDAGGLISLALWAICPNILAHAGLVTPDLGSTVVALLATYQFWRYVRAPSTGRVVLCGILLGLTEASKFSFVVLPAAWAALAGLRLWTDRRGGSPGAGLGARRALGHAALLTLVALLALNDVYLAEGTGRPLGSFEFRSKLLTAETGDEAAGRGAEPRRENRFRGTFLDRVPVPLPEHYLLGFDDQTFDLDSGHY